MDPSKSESRLGLIGMPNDHPLDVARVPVGASDIPCTAAIIWIYEKCIDSQKHYTHEVSMDI